MQSLYSIQSGIIFVVFKKKLSLLNLTKILMIVSNNIFFPLNENPSKFILYFRNLRFKIKYWFGQIGYLILIIPFTPLLLILWGVIKVGNNQLDKTIKILRANLAKVDTKYLIDNYRLLRSNYEKANLRKIEVEKLENILQNELERDFITNIFLIQINQYNHLCQSWLDMFDIALSRLDDDTPRIETFMLTPENEIWKNRNKVYQFRL